MARSRKAAAGLSGLVALMLAALALYVFPQTEGAPRTAPPADRTGAPAGIKPGEEVRGEVVAVSDGDTLQVMRDGRAVKIRLFGIDCPERKQPFGSRAKRATSDLAFGKIVTVRVRAQDRYGRLVGEVTLPDGKSLNQELLRLGLAWWYKSYAKRERAFEQLEQEARAERRGLWADPDPTPPWKFRKLNRKT